MKREAVADRIITYCDALMAFSLVNGFAFLVALAEPDIRCSIANIAVFMGGVTVISPLAASFALVWLRRYELRLRGGVSDDAVVSRLENRQHLAFRVDLDLRLDRRDRDLDCDSGSQLLTGAWLKR